MKQQKSTNLMALLCLLLILLCHDIYAQLPAFTITLTATPQTCLGNGSLNFSVSGTTTGASLDYAVYLLPNTTTPVATVTSPVVNGLVAGTYKVVATQTLGSQSNTATANATINDNTTELAFTLQTSPCINGGMITVNVTSGTAVSYEIIAGPQIRPLQSSNVFINLPFGLYSVRVHDACGDAVVVDVNLQILPADFYIGFSGVSDLSLPACDMISVGNYIFNTYDMLWPVTLTLTVHPPGGGANVIVNKVVTGPAGDDVYYVDVPFYYDQSYTYDLKVTDACGNIKTTTATIPTQKFDFALDAPTLTCDDFILTVDMSVYKTPVTVSFTSAPAGFNPSLFSASHPVFTADNIVYGSASNPIPFGNYTVKITDACGHSATHSITVNNQGIPSVESGIGDLSSCYGYFKITMPFNRNITSAIITIAPSDYPGTLPQDVTSLANGDTLTVDDIPAGNYTVIITDSCGIAYTVNVQIVEGPPDFTYVIETLPGCEENEGSMSIYAHRFTQVIITAAPAAYANVLPYDASANIWSYGFAMGSLPPGNYSIQTTDDCGTVVSAQFYITPYEVLSADIEVIPGCGSFDVRMNYVTNSTVNFVETFWLQKYDDNIGMWTNPLNGSPYTEGAPVYNVNAVQINNNADNYFAYSGKFRIIRVLGSYADPGLQGQYVRYCVAQIDEFTYYDNPHINGAYGFSCGDGTSDVIIDAQGLAPLTYEITAKNGLPFSLSNDTSNYFEGLDNGIYNFKVTDGCGNFLNIQYDITQLQTFSIQPSFFCEGQDGSINVQGFSFLNYEWWKEGAPGTILSTESSLDIASFNSATDSGTYFVHITGNNAASCIDQTLSVTVTADPLPHAGTDGQFSICNNGLSLDLTQYLEDGHDEGGVWQDLDATGQLQQNVLITNGLAAGTYHFKYTVTNSCNVTDGAVIMLTFKLQPETPLIGIDGPVCEGNTLALTASTVEDAAYSWTGPNGFTSQQQNPVLQNVSANAAGLYMLNITVPGTDCPSVPASVIVVVNKIPEFTIEGTTAICNDGEVTLTVNAQNFENNITGHTYTWYRDNQQLINNNWFIQTNEAGTYRVIVDTGGCTAEKEIVVTKNNLGITLEAGCTDHAYVINMKAAVDLSTATITWSGPDNFTFTGTSPDITDLKPGQYTVTVATTDGCMDSASVTVENTDCSGISRGVSPNGDGLNDSFDLTNLNVARLEIFNRYGLMIYKAENYKKEWHGQTDNGGEVPTGTYYYVIWSSAGGTTTGWVYLNRQY